MNVPVKSNRRSEGRSQRWAGHRDRRRVELVDAALDAIREHGAGVSVAAIAAAAGVTKPVIYRHFADRADLQRAVSERAAGMLTERMVPELAGQRKPEERVRAVVAQFLAAAEEEPELWRFVVHNPGNREAEDVVAHSIAAIAALLTRALGDTLRARGRDSGGAEAWAYGLAGMVYTAGDWWLQRRTLSREALTDHLTALIWNGLSGVLGGPAPTTGISLPEQPDPGQAPTPNPTRRASDGPIST